VRASYGRLLAYIAARSRDVAAAEDALAEALSVALRAWAERGVPENPEAWLLTVARHNLGHAARHGRVRAEVAVTLKVLAEEAQERAMRETVFPDERLKLLFICAHPAIDAAARAPLMLQTVLGLDALRIASAFLVAPATMGQRLVRAKAKIRDAGIAFTIPESEDLAPRLDAVLDAIYAAYGSGWEDVTGSDPRRRGLAEEAIWLARLVVGLLPEEPEARGLLALMLHCEARRPARRGHDGGFVPLSEQDVRRWSQPLIDEAEEQLAQASHAERLGRFQLEAAIQSVHAQRGVTGKTDWQAVAMLYAGLVRLTPAIGASIGHAAAMAEACGAESGLALLLEAPIGSVEAYQPYWALRAHLYRRLGRRDAAAECYGRAIGLTEDPAVRAWLTQRRDGLGEAS
jgi:RNA polymerase sigma-70 factor (ECF subfamily)